MHNNVFDFLICSSFLVKRNTIFHKISTDQLDSMKQIQLQLSQLRDLDVRELVHRNVPALPRHSAPSTLVTKITEVAALDAVDDCGLETDPKEKKMSRERKLNVANDIANAKEPVNNSFRNESNGSMFYVPVPTSHGLWDAMPNVCQGFQWKLYNQGKFFFINCWYFCIKL